MQPDTSNIIFQLDNNYSCNVKSIGDVNVTNGELHDIFYVPNLKSNLISIVKNFQDYKIEFYKDMCCIIDPKNNQVIANTKMDMITYSNFMSLLIQNIFCLIPLI